MHKALASTHSSIRKRYIFSIFICMYVLHVCRHICMEISMHVCIHGHGGWNYVKNHTQFLFYFIHWDRAAQSNPELTDLTSLLLAFSGGPHLHLHLPRLELQAAPPCVLGTHTLALMSLTSEQSHCHRKFVVLDFVVVAFWDRISLCSSSYSSLPSAGIIDDFYNLEV